MEIIRDLDAMAPRKNPVVAFGNFDGVHLGHRAILRAAVDRARDIGGSALTLTFEPPPARFLAPERAPQLILTPADKLRMLGASGVDGVIVLEFNRALSLVKPRDFVRRFLLGKLGVKAVVVGHSVSFGHNREGNATVMVEFGREFGFDTTVVGPVKVGEVQVSSTRVRAAIAAGDVAQAARMLGRPHFLSGAVVRGRERGRTIGFPTANLESETECVPQNGVYATRVVIGEESLASITNIGMRPTFAEQSRSIEAHIFDFNRDIYGSKIRLELIGRIRGERKFDSPEALADQIRRDLAEARQILSLP